MTRDTAICTQWGFAGWEWGGGGGEGVHFCMSVLRKANVTYSCCSFSKFEISNFPV